MVDFGIAGPCKFNSPSVACWCIALRNRSGCGPRLGRVRLGTEASFRRAFSGLLSAKIAHALRDEG